MSFAICGGKTKSHFMGGTYPRRCRIDQEFYPRHVHTCLNVGHSQFGVPCVAMVVKLFFHYKRQQN
jgi:hypothetical protein